MESANDWLRILQLCAKIAVLVLKNRYFRYKNHILLRKCDILIHEQRQLLLKKVDNVLR